MRIWSLHPKYLDSKGLVALWRETLLAQNVLMGNTKGYTNHPQLARFKEQKNPIEYIGTYLSYIVEEATARKYNFDSSKIHQININAPKLAVTSGQMQFELEHLKRKLEIRDPERFLKSKSLVNPDPHPIFTIIDGGIADWERV